MGRGVYLFWLLTPERQLFFSIATLRVPELEFEIEAGTQKAQLTTVEGVLSGAAKHLRAGQEERRAEKIIKSLIRADQRATLKEKKPIAKVDKFTKQMHHKRERQRINEELRRMTR